MKVKDKVILKSFLELTEAPKDTKDSENYWKLIGKRGTIVAKKSTLHPYYPKNGFQVLVVFDAILDEIGLINHNKIPNSIWIFENDLEKMKIKEIKRGRILNKTYYPNYNHQGSLRALIDINGKIAKEITCIPYGKILNDTNQSLHVHKTFANGLYDKDTNLIRFGKRDYDLRTWTAKDPIDFSGGDSNLYRYAHFAYSGNGSHLHWEPKRNNNVNAPRKYHFDPKNPNWGGSKGNSTWKGYKDWLKKGGGWSWK